MEKEQQCVLLSLDVGEGFDLEKAVCSHGFFMMAPNLWFPSSKTLQRPLRLTDTTSIMVRISQQQQPPSQLKDTIIVRVLGRSSLADQDKRLLLAQVARMLRISEEDDKKISGFHQIHGVAKESGFGRVFRAPTLFEDMVKSILLCNCQWPRTLSMARALCEFQSELKGEPLGYSDAEAATHPNHGRTSKAVDEDVAPPNTPALIRESKRKRGKLPPKNIIMQLGASATLDSKATIDLMVISQHPQKKQEDSSLNVAAPSIVEEEKYSWRQLSNGTVTVACNSMGDFPRPEEVAILDENILAKRCNLGYRANRILRLAQSIVKDRLEEMLQACDGNYDQVWNKLLGIYGFGPFTCANVLMCMGFYQTIPADTETVRHLKQFHRKSDCNINSVKREIEAIYGKYAPFQFLAYWSELWECYEKRFGKLSQMPHSDYQLITGHNMKKNAANY